MFIFSFLGIINALLNMFLFCYLGKIASESYKNIAVSSYECNWHALPLDLQKYFIIMIADAQIPLRYHGYGVITLNMETFCNVISSVLIILSINRFLKWINNRINYVFSATESRLYLLHDVQDIEQWVNWLARNKKYIIILILIFINFLQIQC